MTSICKFYPCWRRLWIFACGMLGVNLLVKKGTCPRNETFAALLLGGLSRVRPVPECSHVYCFSDNFSKALVTIHSVSFSRITFQEGIRLNQCWEYAKAAGDLEACPVLPLRGTKPSTVDLWTESEGWPREGSRPNWELAILIRKGTRTEKGHDWFRGGSH